MEVPIYIAGALVTLAVGWVIVDGENMGKLEKLWLLFGFAGVWPIIWMLFIPVAIMGVIEHFTNPKNVLQCKHGKGNHRRGS